MEIKEVQISEIKNLNMIYVFAIDTVSDKDTNKYVGAKVVYDKIRTLSLDYRDKHFQSFIKRIIERYNIEKDKRKIILLGDLTEKLMNDSSFAILAQDLEKGNQTQGIPAFNTQVSEVSNIETYLKETLEMIILLHKNYDVLNIEHINGFGTKFIATYDVGPVKKQLPLIIAKREDGIFDFKMSRIDELNIPINGVVVVDTGRVDVIFESEDEGLKGTIVYDANSNVVERRVTLNNRTVRYDEDRETLLEDDVERILFYSELCNLGKIEGFNIIKTSDDAYLLGIETSTLDEKKGIVETGLTKNLQLNDEKILYERKGIQIDLEENEARIRFSHKNSLSKYNETLNSVLTQELEEITLRKIEIDYKPHVLMERKYRNGNHKTGYSYEVFEVEGEIDLRRPFTYTNRYPVNKEVKTIESVKQYVRERKGGVL